MLQGWHRLTFNFLIALLVGWWMLRLPIADSNKHLLLAVIAGAVAVDFAITFFIRRNRSKKVFRFLNATTMPKMTTYAELWRQVALSTLINLCIITIGALILILTVFESPVVPILMVAAVLATQAPHRYWSLRRRYRKVEVQNGADTHYQLELVANIKVTEQSSN